MRKLKLIFKITIIYILFSIKVFSIGLDTNFIDLEINDLGIIPKDKINLIDKLLQEKKYSKTLYMLQKYSKEYGENNQVLLTYYGLLYYKQNRFELAKNYWLKACSGGDTYYVPFYDLAILYYRLGDLENSKEYFEKALNLRGETDLNIIKNLAVIYRELGDYNKSELFFNTIKDKMPRFEYYKEIGVLYYLQDKPDALNYFLKSYRLNKSDPWVMFYISQIKVDNNFEDALNYINMALSIEKNEVFIYQKAYVLYVGGDKDEVDKFIKSLDLNSIKSKNTLLLLADVAIKNSDDKLLKKIIKIVEKRGSYDTILLSNVASYYFNTKRYNLATNYFSKALKSVENEFDKITILLELGKSYYQIDSLNQAFLQFKRVLKFGEYSQAYYYLALIKMKQNSSKLAKQYIKKAIKFESNNSLKDEYNMLLSILDKNKSYQKSNNEKLVKKDLKKAIIIMFINKNYGDVIRFSKNSNDKDILYFRAVSLYNVGKYSSAINIALKLDKSEKILKLLADINFKLKNYNKAIGLYKKVNNRECVYMQALCYYRMNRLNKSLILLNSIKNLSTKEATLLGAIYAKNGKLIEARKIWQQNQKKSSYDIKRNLVLTDYYLKNYKKALSGFIKLKKMYVDSIKLNIDIANCYIQLKDYKIAIKYLNRAPKIDIVYYDKALVLSYLGRYSEAKKNVEKIKNKKLKKKISFYISYFAKNYRNAIAISKSIENNQDVLIKLAKSYSSIGEYKKSMDILQNLEDSVEVYGEVIREKIYIYGSINKFDKAINLFNNLKMNSIDSLNYFVLLINAKKYKQAYDFSKEREEYFAKLETSSYYNMLIKLGKYEQLYNLVLKIDKKQKQPISLIALAIYYNGKKDYEKMRQLLLKAKKIDSDIDTKYRNLFKVIKEFENYKTEINKSLIKQKRARDSISNYNNLVNSFNYALQLQKSNKIDTALVIYNDLYNKKFYRAELFINLISIYIQKNNLTKVKTILNRAIELYPNNLYIKYNKAVYLYNIGKKNDAVYVLRTIENDLKEAKDLLKRINRGEKK